MSEKNTGGPAFPVLHSIDGNWIKESIEEFRGMTLRDYFAAKALAAMIAQPDKEGANRGASGVPILAAFSYEYADAMLKARQS